MALTDLKVVRTVAAASLLLAMTTSEVSAEWLTLFEPKQTAVGDADSDRGREAFSAFGCIECHSGLSDQGYRSGFRILGEGADGADGETLSAKMAPPNSPVMEGLQHVRLGDRDYRQSSENSAVFLRQVHKGVPGVQPSLTLLNEAEKEQQQAALDYILMF